MKSTRKRKSSTKVLEGGGIQKKGRRNPATTSAPSQNQNQAISSTSAAHQHPHLPANAPAITIGDTDNEELDDDDNDDDNTGDVDAGNAEVPEEDPEAQLSMLPYIWMDPRSTGLQND